jgi:hypothetical protein
VWSYPKDIENTDNAEGVFFLFASSRRDVRIEEQEKGQKKEQERGQEKEQEKGKGKEQEKGKGKEKEAEKAQEKGRIRRAGQKG